MDIGQYLCLKVFNTVASLNYTILYPVYPPFLFSFNYQAKTESVQGPYILICKGQSRLNICFIY